MSFSLKDTEKTPEIPEEPTIRLEFFRHDYKDETQPNQSDQNIRLTTEGREHATEMGRSRNPHPEVGLVYCSPRDRSAETALRQLLANEADIQVADTLEDIQRKIRKKIQKGHKIVRTDKLDYSYASKGFREATAKHYTESKDLAQFMFEESDSLVLGLKDANSTSYSRNAGNVAELIKKYIEVFPSWERVAKSKPEKYIQFNNEMQRFMGSHLAVTECFLMKVIEKLEGKLAVREFLTTLSDKNGFDFSEGYSVVICRRDGLVSIEVTFMAKTRVITPELIQQIINEKNELNETIGLV